MDKGMDKERMTTEGALALLNNYAAYGCDLPDDHMKVAAALDTLRVALDAFQAVNEDLERENDRLRQLAADNERLRDALLELDPPGIEYPERMAGRGWIVEDGFDAGVDAANEWWRGVIRAAVEGTQVQVMSSGKPG